MKTTESDLDGVVEWDEKLVVGSEELKAALTKLRDDVDEGATDVKKDIRAIEKYVDDLRDGLNERKLVLKGLADSAAPAEEEAPAPAAEPEEEPEKKKRGLFGRRK
jgi:peptidoglycan hydrolase CwlO-like protein